MARFENRRVTSFLFGTGIGVLIAYAIVVTPAFQQYILRLETGN